MRTKKVTRYYAECGRGFWKKAACEAHEENCMCWTNPKNRACKTCKHGEYAPYEDDTGYGGFWECHAPGSPAEHSGGPKGVDYISVGCGHYKPE